MGKLILAAVSELPVTHSLHVIPFHENDGYNKITLLEGAWTIPLLCEAVGCIMGVGGLNASIETVLDASLHVEGRIVHNTARAATPLFTGNITYGDYSIIVVRRRTAGKCPGMRRTCYYYLRGGELLCTRFKLSCGHSERKNNV